jgi:uncharacterized protein YecT (DUF1311 family)
MRKTALLALLASLAACPASAAPCADQTQPGLDACAGVERYRADAELNGVYKQIVARLKDTPAAGKRLVDAENAWIAFRDAECAFSTVSTEGGTIHSMEVTLCDEKLTRDRTRQLRRYLKCEEGDMSCPVPAP